MSYFRLFDATFNEKALFSDKIRFVENSEQRNNYFTLIIGNNGSGKSRILSYIAKYFIQELNERRRSRSIINSELNYNRLPSKVIAITNSISDKFPIDLSYKFNKFENDIFFHRDLKYNYLGARNRMNVFSNRSMIYKALDILFENYSELDVSRNYRYIFDYLDYEPVIKLNYKLSDNFLKFIGNEATPDKIYSFFNNHSTNRYYSFRTQNENILKLLDNKIFELCEFIN